MVLSTQILGYAVKATRKLRRHTFLDTLRFNVKAGTGGSGLPQFGGTGGTGGNVYLLAKNGMTLHNLRQKIKKKRLFAEGGGHSSKKGIIGQPGEDLIIEVPTGITALTDDGIKLGELDKEGSKVLIAKGGLGGCEPTGFCGQKGQNHTIILDLKLIADVGLIGFPNAGKSTFLAAISKANPKIASYPFTTIRPQIGVMMYNDLRKISVADLPGLIEGAHENLGMGYKFLKHVERTKILLFLVDIQGFRLSTRHNYRTCLETIILLNKEIEMYNPDLLKMPALLIVNKMDTKDADSKYKEMEPHLLDLSRVLTYYPDEMRPKNVLQFNDIIRTSLINKKEEELNYIKSVIRDTIDKREELKLFQQDNLMGDTLNPEKKLVEKLNRQIKRNVPVLV